MLLGFRLLGSRDAGKSGSKGFRSFLSGSRPDLFRAYPMSFSSGAAAADLAAKHEQEASKSILGKKNETHTLLLVSRLLFQLHVEREKFSTSLSLSETLQHPFRSKAPLKRPPPITMSYVKADGKNWVRASWSCRRIDQTSFFCPM